MRSVGYNCVLILVSAAHVIIPVCQLLLKQILTCRVWGVNCTHFDSLFHIDL